MAGRPHGHGRYYIPTGIGRQRLQYEGDWVQGRKEGLGTNTYRNGEVYRGEFLANERHGHGRMEYLNGNVYEGDWMEGRRRGYGTLMYANGDVFRGFWINDKREGLGCHYWVRMGNKYEGEWVADNPVCGEVLPIHRKERKELTQFENISQVAESHLPPLALNQPHKVMYHEVVGVRRARTADTGTRRRAQRMQGTLDESHLERLKHAFVALAGGDGRESSVRANQLHDMCVVAGLDPADPHVQKLKGEMEASLHRGQRLYFNEFLEVLVTHTRTDPLTGTGGMFTAVGKGGMQGIPTGTASRSGFVRDSP